MRYRNGWTVYQAIGEVSRFRDAPQVELGKVKEVTSDSAGEALAGDLGWSDPDTHSEEELARLRDVVRRMDVHVAEIRMTLRLSVILTARSSRD